MSGYRLERDYDAEPEEVWAVLTEPELVAAWTITGQGARPVGFRAEPGQRFQFVGRPTPGWDGVVECEVLEARAPQALRFTWKGGPDDDVTTVTCSLTRTPSGTRLCWEHEGFTGLGGFIVSRILRRVRRTMMTEGIPPVLARLKSGRG